MNQGYMEYAAVNNYHPLVSAAAIEAANNSFYKSGGCKDLVGFIFVSFVRYHSLRADKI